MEGVSPGAGAGYGEESHACRPENECRGAEADCRGNQKALGGFSEGEESARWLVSPGQAKPALCVRFRREAQGPEAARAGEMRVCGNPASGRQPRIKSPAGVAPAALPNATVALGCFSLPELSSHAPCLCNAWYGLLGFAPGFRISSCFFSWKADLDQKPVLGCNAVRYPHWRPIAALDGPLS